MLCLKEESKIRIDKYIVSKDNILRAKKLIQTVIQDLGRELTPTLKYDFYLRLKLALELLEGDNVKAEESQG